MEKDGKRSMLRLFVFFFSSRRRHTRFDCDWSSDVCSSDLDQIVVACALERFRNDNEALAETLEKLVPNYLSAVPHDVFTGEPLRYTLSAEIGRASCRERV